MSTPFVKQSKDNNTGKVIKTSQLTGPSVKTVTVPKEQVIQSEVSKQPLVSQTTLKTQQKVVKEIQTKVGNTFSSSERDALELELAYRIASINYFKKTTFDGFGKLTVIDIFPDSNQIVGDKLWNKIFSYNGSDQLTTVVTTRISDSAIVTRNLTYNLDGTLSSIEKV